MPLLGADEALKTSLCWKDVAKAIFSDTTRPENEQQDRIEPTVVVRLWHQHQTFNGDQNLQDTRERAPFLGIFSMPRPCVSFTTKKRTPKARSVSTKKKKKKKKKQKNKKKKRTQE
jgi:hypothetical protein